MPMQQDDSSIGQIIDGYRILEVLGKGGMGIVYKAEDIALSRAVAIKMIAPELSSNESFLRRFHSEARALARVESPFIVGVHALRQVNDSFFIVMEYVDGWTLADEIEKGTIDFARVRVVLRQMLQAFSRAHSVGVIHRDIKPRNIMITKAGRVKVTDFGLAKLRQDDGKSTVTQGMAGTARYMSPEQVLGSETDHRSDLYSLGMTMYEMVAGVLPFSVDEGTFSILKRIVEEDLPSPLEYNPNIPKGLVNIVERAIKKDPAHRFQTAQQMLEALDKVFKNVREAPTIAGAQPSQIHIAPQSLQKKSKKTPLVVASIVACLLLIYPISLLISGGSTDSDEPKSLANQLGVNPIENQQHTGQPPIKLAKINVSTFPSGATVIANQDSIGIASDTGAKFELPEGNVTLAVQLDGYQQLDTTVVVTSEKLNLINLPLVKRNEGDSLPVEPPDFAEDPIEENPDPVATRRVGTVQLQASPAGKILVAGGSYNNNTSNLTLEVGTHDVIFEDIKTGIRLDTKLTVREGGLVQQTCYFLHRLSIGVRWAEPAEEQVPWANIFINGKNVGSSPYDQDIEVGEYTIELKKHGYILEGPERFTISPTLKKEDTNRKLFFTIRKAQE